MYLDLILGDTTLRAVLENSKGRGVKVPDDGSSSVMLWDPDTEFSYKNETNVFFTTTYHNLKSLTTRCGKDWNNRKLVELAVREGQKFTRHGEMVHFGN